MPKKPEKNAKELVEEVRKETARRKRIWRKMEAAAREVVNAVTQEARKCGIRNMDWFGWHDAEMFDVAGAQEVITVWYANPSNPNPSYRSMSFELLKSGAIDELYLGRGEYEGYLELTTRDPIIFKRAATEQLMGCLTNYIKDSKSVKKRGKKK